MLQGCSPDGLLTEMKDKSIGTRDVLYRQADSIDGDRFPDQGVLQACTRLDRKAYATFCRFVFPQPSRDADDSGKHGLFRHKKRYAGVYFQGRLGGGSSNQYLFMNLQAAKPLAVPHHQSWLAADQVAISLLYGNFPPVAVSG